MPAPSLYLVYDTPDSSLYRAITAIGIKAVLYLWNT